MPQEQLGRKVVYFKKGQGPMARMKQGGVVRNGQKMVVGPRRRLNQSGNLQTSQRGNIS